MNIVLLSWLAAVIGYLAYFVIKTLWLRGLMPINWFRGLMILYALLLPCVYFGARYAYLTYETELQSASDIFLFANSALILSFFFLPCLSFYSMVDHSVRVRVSVEFAKLGGGPVSMSRILKIYDPEAAAIRRIQKMVDGGYTSKLDETSFALTDKGGHFGRGGSLLKKFFKIKHD